jgi:hypothetical protein
MPARTLRPLIPPDLSLETYENLGFLAIAMVQTHKMRPRFARKSVFGAADRQISELLEIRREE